MSHTIQLDREALGFVGQVVHTQSDDNLKASLKKLEALLEMVAEVETTPAVKGSDIASDVLTRLGPILQKADPTSAAKLISSLAPLLNAYAAGSKEAAAKIVDILAPVIRGYVLKNPNGFMEVISVIAPLVRGDSSGLREKLAIARKAFVAYEKASLGATGMSEEFEREVAPSLRSVGHSVTVLESAYSDLKPRLAKLHTEDPSRMQTFLNRLNPVLSAMAFSNVGHIDLEGLYHLDDKTQESHLAALHASAVAASPVVSGSLGMAMMFLQQFQVALSQSQANQDQITTQIGQAMIHSAESLQGQIASKMAEAQSQQTAASQPKPWWEWVIIVVVSVLAVVVAGITAGLGAALVALAVGAFMTSPLFNMTVQAIAKGIESDLQKKYEAEGMSPADAKEKATAVADIIAKVIVTVGVMVLSCGLGGIATVADSAASSATDTGIEMTNMGADEAAEEGGEEAAEEGAESTNSSSKSYSYSLVKGLRLAAFQGVSTLTMSNIWMDAMETNPEWLKTHETAAMVIDIVAEVLGAVIAMAMGAKCLGGASEGGSFFESFSSKLRFLIPMSLAAQAGQGGVESWMAAKRATYLENAAGMMELVGQLEAELSIKLAGVQMSSDTQNINDTSASNITKGDSQEMNALESASGKMWDATGRVLR